VTFVFDGRLPQPMPMRTTDTWT